MLLEISRLKMSFYFRGYARRRSSARELLWKATLNAGLIYSGLTTLPSSTRSSSSSLSVELSAWAVGILETVDRLCRFCLLFWLYVKRNNVIRAVRILNVRLNIPWVQPVIKINSCMQLLLIYHFLNFSLYVSEGFTEESSKWWLFWLKHAVLDTILTHPLEVTNPPPLPSSPPWCLFSNTSLPIC